MNGPPRQRRRRLKRATMSPLRLAVAMSRRMANLINPENPVNFQEDVTIADEQFLQVFDFPLIIGDKRTALQEPYSIIINEDLAMRLFNKKEVIGKILQFSFMDEPLKITGILKNHPRNSSFSFNSLISDASFKNTDFYKNMIAGDWLSNNFSVYALLKHGTDPESVSVNMKKLVDDNFKTPAGVSFSFSLQSLNDMHLKSENIVDGAGTAMWKLCHRDRCFISGYLH